MHTTSIPATFSPASSASAASAAAASAARAFAARAFAASPIPPISIDAMSPEELRETGRRIQDADEQQLAALETPAADPAANPSARHPGGRPSNYSPEIVERICDLIMELGCSPTAAAARLRIPASPLSRWKTEHPDLQDNFATAREVYRSELLETLHNASTRDGRPDWRAAA